MLTFVKLGGSLITDKRVEGSFREAVVGRLAREIQAAVHASPDLQVLIGHGSGSFGHFAASRYRTVEGVYSQEAWHTFAEVGWVAADLNHLVAGVFRSAGLPIFRVQPSASVMAEDGSLVSMSVETLRAALSKGLLPLVYGDVAFDSRRGGTIVSTEKIFFYLAQHLPVKSILLLGEVAGVYGDGGSVIPEITPSNLADVMKFLGGSSGVDVTGGMETKVSDMLALVEAQPDLTIRILDGTQKDLLFQTLTGKENSGTLIRADTT